MKKRKNIGIQDRERWISEWNRNWTKGNYKPFIRTEDVVSYGSKHRAYGLKSKRVHHFLSRNEYLFFIKLEFDNSVSEIYEQFPLLPVNRTREIAKELNIKHPKYIRTPTNMVMTTDFFVTLNTGESRAYSIKPRSALKSSRTIQKQFIEKYFWESKGVPWKIIYDDQLKVQYLYNLDFLRHHAVLPSDLISVQSIWLQKFTTIIAENDYLRTSDIIEKVASYFGLEIAQSSTLLLHSLWNKDLTINLDRPLGFENSPTQLNILRNVKY
jgi:hypothetical protein